MADVVANRVYLTDVAAFGEMNKAYVPHFPKNPPARATVIVGLPGPTYKVESHDDRGERGPKTGDHDAGRRRHARQAEPDAEQRHQGRQAPLSSSGMLGNNADNKGNVEAQTKEAMARIERTLKAGGFELDRSRRRRRLHHRHRATSRR